MSKDPVISSPWHCPVQLSLPLPLPQPCRAAQPCLALQQELEALDSHSVPGMLSRCSAQAAPAGPGTGQPLARAPLHTHGLLLCSWSLPAAPRAIPKGTRLCWPEQPLLQPLPCSPEPELGLLLCRARGLCCPGPWAASAGLCCSAWDTEAADGAPALTPSHTGSGGPWRGLRGACLVPGLPEGLGAALDPPGGLP